MEYKYFYLAVRRYAKGKISREVFRMDWRDEQRRQGITPQKGRRARHERKDK
jgi:hypothetical protein